jgi:hypothetical protein
MTTTPPDSGAAEGSAGTSTPSARAIAAAPARVAASRMSPSCGTKCARENDPDEVTGEELLSRTAALFRAASRRN